MLQARLLVLRKVLLKWKIRRPSGTSYNETDFIIALRELQCWVNDSNIMINGDIIRYFAEFTNKDVDVGSYLSVSNINNNIIKGDGGGAVSSTDYNNKNISLICKEIPRTKIQDIQSIVVYNRARFDRGIGRAIELYNSLNDPNLESPLASTNEITTEEEVYRYDFPAIDTYSGVFFDTDSITQIASDTLALKEVVSEFAESANITGGLKVDTITTTGNVDITGDLVVNGVNVITEIGTKQDEITTTTDLTCNTLSAVGDITTTGYLNDKSHRYFLSGNEYDLNGLTTFNLRTTQEFLTDFATHDGIGRYEIQNLNSTKFCIITIICSVSSDVYDSGISWRLTPFRSGSNFPAFGNRYCFTNGASSLQSEALLVTRVFTGLVNGQYFNFVIDQDRGTGTYGEVMDGSKY